MMQTRLNPLSFSIPHMIVALCLVGIIAACGTVPSSTVAPTADATLLPADFSILPPFTPDYPCALEDATATDESLCRSEYVRETLISEDDQQTLIQRDYHVGQGCWSSINVDTHELRVCEKEAGAVTVLTAHLASPVIQSPDGNWFAFNTFEWVMQPEQGALPVIHIYRIQRDDTDMQMLDTQGLPQGTVGAQFQGWSSDGLWLQFQFWNGTENGWSAYRLKADGSGIYEPAAANTGADSLYMTEAETPLRECPERSCPVASVIPAGESLPVVQRHDTGSDYWLEVDYEHESRYVGPFVMVSGTYSNPTGAARSCPDSTCPVRFTIPADDYILSLNVVVANLAEYWTQTVYQGEEVYLGPWTPPPGNSIWQTTVIPASEAARAQGTGVPTPSLATSPAVSATRRPTLTPSATPGA